MAKNSIRDFDATSGNNTDIQSVDISEGCAASGINNAIRELMVDLKNVSTGAVNLETPGADQLNVDNIRIDGNTISSTDTNGDVIVDPNGTGGVGIGDNTPDSKLKVRSTSGTSTDIGIFEAAVGSYTGTSLVAKNSLGPASTYNLFECVTDSDGDAGGPFTEFVVRGDGSVGIGTTSPDSPLHVIGDGKFKASGETKIRFQNDTTGTGSSDGSFVGVFGGTDGMALYNYEATPMRFFTSNTERMRIAAGTSGGLVRIGQSSDFAGGANSRLAVFVDSSSPAMVTETGDTSGRSHLSFRNGNGEVGGIDTSGSSTSYNTSSDHRLKENVADMTGAIDRVKALAPKRFNFIADPDTTVDGFVAHEAQTVVPEAVTGAHNEVDDDGNAIMQGIDQSKLVPLLTGALKEAVAKIETLETEMTALKARVTALEA